MIKMTGVSSETISINTQNVRVAVMDHYIKFLSESVALDYENTEQTNKSLSDLFK